jgi:predicted glycosyl hydrolase (DUF1957 family)
MKDKLFRKMLDDSGFVLWEDESWKPEGAIVDWANDYDKEVKRLIHVVLEEVVKTMAMHADPKSFEADRLIKAIFEKFDHDSSI